MVALVCAGLLLSQAHFIHGSNSADFSSSWLRAWSTATPRAWCIGISGLSTCCWMATSSSLPSRSQALAIASPISWTRFPRQLWGPPLTLLQVGHQYGFHTQLLSGGWPQSAGLLAWLSSCSCTLSAAVCHVDHPSGHAMLPMPAPSERVVPSKAMLQRTGADAADSDCIYYQPAATTQGYYFMLLSICFKSALVWHGWEQQSVLGQSKVAAWYLSAVADPSIMCACRAPLVLDCLQL